MPLPLTPEPKADPAASSPATSPLVADGGAGGAAAAPAAALAASNSPAPAPSAAAKPRLPSPLTIPYFRNLWMGSTVSLLGDQFYLVALPWLVLQLTGSSLALGTILMAAGVPRAALMLMGGAISDRFAPRRILIATACARTLLVAAIALLTSLHLIQLWHLYFLAFAFGVADAFSFPASGAMMPTLVKPEQLPAANALFASSAQASTMLGPAPAGLVIKRWGMAPAFWADAVSFLFAIAALLRVPEVPRPAPPPGAPPKPSVLHSIAEGLRYVHRDHALRSLMLLAAGLNLCAIGPIMVGLAMLAKFHFGSSAAYGTFISCFGAGALAGMILAGTMKHPRRRGLMLLGAAALQSVGLALLGVLHGFAAVVVILALMGLVGGLVNVTLASWMQARVERALLGRVMSVLMFSALGLVPISSLIAGAVAQLHLDLMFVAAGAGMLLVTLVAAADKGARAID
ncbi:MAG TPA: MFS transporter [Terriglobales bacterium]|nr:MFS transporter [Terriglobales bacterium]